jgi:hypothetical protein
MIGLCLGLAGVVWAQLPFTGITLAWNHTVEKVRREEDYRITEPCLVPGEARVCGNGAGMDIPEDAFLENGSWHYRHPLSPRQPLKLGRTPQAGDYQLCFEGRCQAMSIWMGAPDARQPGIELWACERY